MTSRSLSTFSERLHTAIVQGDLSKIQQELNHARKPRVPETVLITAASAASDLVLATLVAHAHKFTQTAALRHLFDHHQTSALQRLGEACDPTALSAIIKHVANSNQVDVMRWLQGKALASPELIKLVDFAATGAHWDMYRHLLPQVSEAIIQNNLNRLLPLATGSCPAPMDLIEDLLSRATGAHAYLWGISLLAAAHHGHHRLLPLLLKSDQVKVTNVLTAIIIAAEHEQAAALALLVPRVPADGIGTRLFEREKSRLTDAYGRSVPLDFSVRDQVGCHLGAADQRAWLLLFPDHLPRTKAAGRQARAAVARDGHPLSGRGRTRP